MSQIKAGDLVKIVRFSPGAGAAITEWYETNNIRGRIVKVIDVLKDYEYPYLTDLNCTSYGTFSPAYFNDSEVELVFEID